MAVKAKSKQENFYINSTAKNTFFSESVCMHTGIYVFNCVFVCYIDKSGEEVGLVLCISLRSGRGRGRQGLDAAPEEMYQRSRGAPAPEETKNGV